MKSELGRRNLPDIFLPVLFVAVLFSSSGAKAGNVLEDIIDFASALPTLGHYLNERELDEKQLALEIDKRIAQKLDQITDAALKGKIKFHRESMEADMKEQVRASQLLEKTNTSLGVLERMRELIRSRLEGRLVLAANSAALIESRDLAQMNLSLLSVLGSSESKNEAAAPAFLLISERLKHLSKQVGIDVEELCQLAVALEKDQTIAEVDQKFFEQEFVLRAFQSSQLIRAKQLERRIELHSEAIKKLTGKNQPEAKSKGDKK